MLKQELVFRMGVEVMGNECIGNIRNGGVGREFVQNGDAITALTLSLPKVINFNFLFQSLTRDISYSMENLAIVCSDES